MKLLSSIWNFLMICAEELHEYRKGKYSKVK
jgi:hypothetical protein